jgi:hypothetical protein
MKEIERKDVPGVSGGRIDGGVIPGLPVGPFHPWPIEPFPKFPMTPYNPEQPFVTDPPAV